MSIKNLLASFDNTGVPSFPVNVVGSRLAVDQQALDCANTYSYQAAQNDDIYCRFSQYGISSLWYIAHRENIASIVEYGIQNHCVVNQCKMKRCDISDPDVQRRRERCEPCYGRRIHEYAPFYINPRNPMLYALRGIGNDLCLIEVSLSALSDSQYIIADGNAASSDTRFYDSIDQLGCLPWDALNAEYWSNISDGRRKRCSEVLIHPHVDSMHIKAIHCRSADTARYLSTCGRTLEVSTHNFFRNR